MAYDHTPRDLGRLRLSQRRVLRGALAINAAFAAVELVGGALFHSLALYADSAHQAADVVALAVALGALALVERPGSARHTFGLQRAEVLGALGNSAVLAAVSVWIVVEAARRLQHPPHVHGGGVLAVAAVGLVANGASAWLVARSRGHSLNMAAVAAHLASDAAALSVTMVAAGVVLGFGVNRADPIASIVIGVLVLIASWRLLAATVHVLLEGTPRGMDPAEVERALLIDEDVAGVHHLHLWSLASDTPALSAHIVLGGTVTLHEAQERADELKTMLADEFGIDHATLELECHECEAPDDTGRVHTRR